MSKMKKDNRKQKCEIWKDIKNQVRRSKKKDQEELEDIIIIDGNSTVPQSILECIDGIFLPKIKKQIYQ